MAYGDFIMDAAAELGRNPVRACVNDVRKIKIGKSKIKNKRLISKKTLRAMLTENTRTDCPELFTPPVWKPLVALEKFWKTPREHLTVLLLNTAVLMTSS